MTRGRNSSGGRRAEKGLWNELAGNKRYLERKVFTETKTSMEPLTKGCRVGVTGENKGLKQTSMRMSGGHSRRQKPLN